MPTPENLPISPANPREQKESRTAQQTSSDIRPVMTSPIILGEIVLASPETQTTVGAAGGASALPATPTGFLKIVLGDTEYVIPYYAQA